MNEKQKQRFWELKGKKSLTASQREELVQLEEKALKAGLDLENLEPVSSDSQLTENELADIVKSAVEDQVFGLREEILDEVKKAGGTEEVEEIVKKYANNVDQEELLEKLGEKVAGNSINQDSLVEAFKAAVSEFKTDSKMVHAEKSGDIPLIEMPYGNSKESLTVAQKQLHNLLMKKNINQDIPDSSLKIATERGKARLSRIEQVGKALTTGGSGSGQELSSVNVDLASQLQEKLYAESALASRLISSEINMPTNPFKLPVVTSRPEFKLQNEASSSLPAANAPQNIATSNVTLDTFKLVGISEYSYEVDEDSILAILPIITNQLASGAADSFENAVINGDTDATHRDADTAADPANVSAKAVNGIRRYSAGDEVTNGGAAFDSDAVGKMRAKMGAYGLNPRDLALIVSIKDYNALLVQDEISRADSFGGGYTFGSGTLSQIFGIDVVPSARMRTDLTAGGVNAAAASTLGAAALIHVPSWFVGVKRGFTVETDQDKVAQVNQVIASFRRDFKPVFAPSSANGFHSVTMKNIL
jgi:HK97 family phage major capsid protein